MSKTEHTPGPWSIHHTEPRSGEVAVVYCTTTGYVNICGASDREWSNSINDANAHLIAAAPDLYEAAYEALEDMQAVRHSCGTYELQGTVEKLTAALAKARGEATP